MATLFIAALHLHSDDPVGGVGSLLFLAVEARRADALFILGDLFEAWIGEDDHNRVSYTHQTLLTSDLQPI